MYKIEAIDKVINNIKTVTVADINLVYNDGTSRNIKLMNTDLVSILFKTFDNDHNDIYTIVRGKIIEICYNRCNKINSIKLDCSVNYESITKVVDFDTIIDIRDIDYDYEEIEREVYVVVDKKPIVENTSDINVGEVFTTTGDLKKKE